MKRYIIAHDLGTTGNKATLYDQDGVLAGSNFVSYGTTYAQTGWAEQDPEDWWRAVCSSTQALLQKTRVKPAEIACVTFSGQMMGCVPLDARARPLRPAIIWADQRATAQTRWVGERVDLEVMYQITGHRLSPAYSLEKILWVRDHQPDIFKSTFKFVHAKDAIVARLTGKFVTDPSDASGMNLFDLKQGQWSAQILEATAFDPNRLPEVRPSTEVVGEVRLDVADEVGLAAGTPVVIGGGDGACAAAGAGVVRAGAAYNYVGSSSWIAIATAQPIYDPEQRTFTFCHIVPRMFMPIGTMQAAGASYQWARDQLAELETRAAESLGINPYELMNLKAENAPPGANGLIFLPYLLGERSPRWNPNARGAFVGLSMRHTRADMLRAVLEGVTFNLRLILEALTRQGAAITAMRLIGGGARGRFWNELMANIFGLPVQRLTILEEATSMGAALAGGVGTGLYPNFALAELMNPVANTIEPDPQSQAAYAAILPIFEATYQALEPVFELLADR
jgi:xylulokinase